MMAGRLDYWNILEELNHEQWKHWKAIDDLIGLPDLLAARMQAGAAAMAIGKELPERAYHLNAETLRAVEEQQEREPLDPSDLSHLDG